MPRDWWMRHSSPCICEGEASRTPSIAVLCSPPPNLSFSRLQPYRPLASTQFTSIINIKSPSSTSSPPNSVPYILCFIIRAPSRRFGEAIPPVPNRALVRLRFVRSEFPPFLPSHHTGASQITHTLPLHETKLNRRTSEGLGFFG